MSIDIEYNELLSRIIEDADARPDRCEELCELIDEVPHNRVPALLDHLRDVDVGQWSEDQRRRIWLALRNVSGQHLRFPDATWAMPGDLATDVLQTASRFEPTGFLDRVLHLFAAHVEMPAGPSEGLQDFEQLVTNARAEAVREVWHGGGMPDIVRLIHSAEAPWTIGVAIADAAVVPDLVDVSSALLSANDPRLTETARALLHRIAHKDGESAVVALLSDPRSQAWLPTWRAFALAALEFRPATWSLVDAEASAVRDAYWQSVSIYGRGQLAPEVVHEAVQRLRGADNLDTAIALAALYSEQTDAFALLDLLKAAFQSQRAGQVRWDRLGTDVLRLLERLQGSAVDQDEVAILEWALAPFVRSGRFEPTALQNKLARAPQFFVEVLSLVFRSKGEAAPISPDENRQAMARRAFQLLSTWHRPPGVQSSGEIEPSALHSWVAEARRLAENVDRLAIADLQMGEVMAYVPAAADGVWPDVPLRDLVENLQSDDFDKGLVIGISNSRGVTFRGLLEGGAQERTLGQKYEGFAEAVRDQWPRTAALLTRVARGLERQGRREDIEAELDRREMATDDSHEPAL